MIFIHAFEIVDFDNDETHECDLWLNLSEVKCLKKEDADCYAAMSLAEDDPMLYRIDKVCTDIDALFLEMFDQTDNEQQKGE